MTYKIDLVRKKTQDSCVYLPEPGTSHRPDDAFLFVVIY